jgi:segregation and condensation protein A
VTGSARPQLRLVDLELDLEVFAGPFDLLLTLILREEVDLLEVDLAEIVISYVDHLEAKGELDLELATEFLVLIAALLELKSRLMLPGEEIEELDLDPGEAAAELLARLLDAHRYRGAAEHLTVLLAGQAGYRFRSAPLPLELRKARLPHARAVYDPMRLPAAIGELLTPPPEVDVRHISVTKVTVAERLAHIRALLRRGSFNFDEAVAGADRLTVAITLFSLLELYKQGELTWSQNEPFGAIQIDPQADGGAAEGGSAAARAAERAA